MLYDNETCSLKLRKGPKLRAFENRILMIIFWPKKNENGEWRKFHNEELHDLNCSPNIVRLIKSRILRCAGNVARI
jgi:hypothetical protein